MLKTIIKILIKYIKESVSVLLILAISIISYVFGHNIIDYSLLVYYSLFFVLFFAILFTFYQKLYVWCNLKQSIISFLFFGITSIQFLLYVLAIIVFLSMYYNDTFHPIYLNELSVTSQYH